jgi:hypothetical protein
MSMVVARVVIGMPLDCAAGYDSEICPEERSDLGSESIRNKSQLK